MYKYCIASVSIDYKGESNIYYKASQESVKRFYYYTNNLFDEHVIWCNTEKEAKKTY